MQKETYKYFMNLEELENADSGYIDLDSTPKTSVKNNEAHLYGMKKYKIRNRIFYTKPWYLIDSLFSLASSNMYNEIGITTPPQHLAEKTIKAGKQSEKAIFVMTEDIKSLKGVAKQPSSIKRYTLLSDNYTRHNTFVKNKWKILTDDNLREKFLNIMTPECLDDLISLYLADELRTDVDRHSKNYFLIRPQGALRYQKIMPIDLEASELLWQMYTISAKGFSYFVRSAYNSYTPTDNLDYHAYETRLRKIRELLYSGKLSDKNINTLKEELTYDFPEEIQYLIKKYSLKNLPQDSTNKLHTPDNVYDCVSRLWEYNRKHLGKDLEI